MQKHISTTACGRTQPEDDDMLDELKTIKEIDTKDMLGLLSNYPNQIKEAVELAEKADIPTFIKIDDIIITGMGGSGISADLIKEVYREKIHVPLTVNKDYDIPRWAHKDTLCLFLSYSGNTEEVLSAFKMACQKHCNIYCIGSGGKLKELCEHHNAAFIQIPQGIPPRAALAYLLFPLLILLKRMNILKESINHEIEEAEDIVKEACRHFSADIPEKENRAKQLASQLHHSIPHIYGYGPYQSVALRFRQQINENAKKIAFSSTLSEANHNDICGWMSDQSFAKHFSILLIRDRSHESANMSARYNFIKKSYPQTPVKHLIELSPHGKNNLSRALYLVVLADYTSVYLALLDKTDPTPIPAIEQLKEELNKL